MKVQPVKYIDEQGGGAKLQAYPNYIRSIIDTQLKQFQPCVMEILNYVSQKSQKPGPQSLSLQVLDSQIGKKLDRHLAQNQSKGRPNIASDFIPYHSVLRAARDFKISQYNRRQRFLYGIRGLAIKGMVNGDNNQQREFV